MTRWSSAVGNRALAPCELKSWYDNYKRRHQSRAYFGLSCIYRGISLPQVYKSNISSTNLDVATSRRKEVQQTERRNYFSVIVENRINRTRQRVLVFSLRRKFLVVHSQKRQDANGGHRKIIQRNFWEQNSWHFAIAMKCDLQKKMKWLLQKWGKHNIISAIHSDRLIVTAN